MPDTPPVTQFAGDQKKGTWLLAKWEKRFIDRLTPHFPRWIGTQHLTMMTLLWCGVILLSGYLARGHSYWLWGSSLAIIGQWFTDCFDGALGRYRKTGLIKWGYYMDHFLDYLFLCSIMISYGLISSGQSSYYLFFIMAIFSGFLVNVFTSFMVTNQLKISYFHVGPTEIRILFVLINALIIFNQTYFILILPYLLGASFVALCAAVYRTQKKIWQIDMAAKADHQVD